MIEGARVVNGGKKFERTSNNNLIIHCDWNNQVIDTSVNNPAILEGYSIDQLETWYVNNKEFPTCTEPVFLDKVTVFTTCSIFNGFLVEKRSQRVLNRVCDRKGQD